MNHSDLNRVKAIFAEAMEKPKVKRQAFIEQACEENVALKAEVEAFVTASERAGDFLVSPTHDSSADSTSGPSEQPGTKIGPYKLLELIGEGGFGSVFMAEQETPVRRKVALKIIKLGMDTKQVIARFEAERQALAMMEHPNIAKVLDAGTTETGRPYFVMELVHGIPITEYCDKEQLSIRQRVELFIPICQAIQHAHQKGIIHRDIKPNNVLVTMQDGKAVPKIIDFGIAKAINQKLTEKTLFTEFKHFIGTPAYMSPEQAQMSNVDIDTRSDIYSLGVLLYELLTGTTPFDAKQLLSAGLGEMQRVIREVEPPKPSTRLSGIQPETLKTIAGRRRCDARQLSTELRGDPDWIIMCCLEKDRMRRYDTASDLATDAQRYLANQPIRAHPPTAFYQFRKFVRRHRLPIAVIAGILAAMATFAAMYVRGMQAAQQRTLTALAMARSAQHSAEQEAIIARHAAAMSRARYLLQENELPDALGSAVEAHRLGGDWEDGLLLDAVYHRARFDWQFDGRIMFQTAPSSACFCVVNGRDYLVVSTREGLRCFDPHNCQEISETADGADANILSPARPSGSIVAVITPNKISAFELPSLKKLAARTIPQAIVWAEANASETLLIGSDGVCRVVDLKTLQDHAVLDWSSVAGARLQGLPDHGAISPSGRIALHCGRWRNHPLLWNRSAKNGAGSTRWLNAVWGTRLEFVDDHRLASWFLRSPQALEADEIWLNSVDQDKQLFDGSLPTGDIKGQDQFEVWPDGDSVGIGFAGNLGCGTRFIPGDDTVRTFRYASMWPFSDDSAVPLAVAAHSGIVALLSGTTVRVFDRQPWAWHYSDSGFISDYCSACCATGMLEEDGYIPRSMQFEPFDARQPMRSFELQWLSDDWYPWAMATTPGGSTVIIVMEQMLDGGYPVVGANYGPLRALIYHPGDISKAATVWPIAGQFPLTAPSSTGPWSRRLATITLDGKIFCYGAQDSLAVRYAVPDGRVLSQTVLGTVISRSADESLLASADFDGKVRVIDTATGRETVIAQKCFQVKTIHFSADQSQVIVSTGNRLDRFDVSGRGKNGSLQTPLLSIAWPADGDRFLAYRADAIGNGGVLVLADTADGHDLAILDQTSDIVNPEAFFTPSGNELACRLDRWHARVFHNFNPTQVMGALRQGIIMDEQAPATLPAIAAGPISVPPPMQLLPGVLDAGDGSGLVGSLSKNIVVEGVLEQTNWTRGHNAVNLLFQSQASNKLLGWIPPGAMDQFQSTFGEHFDTELIGKRLRIRGMLLPYGGKRSDWDNYLQITLEDPKQLQIVQPTTMPAGTSK